MQQIKINYPFLLFTALTVFHFKASAQKQPQVQDQSVRAPKNVKIDGRMTEWANPFLSKDMTDGYLAAYNSSSRVYYTVSNDDNNLYLVIRGLGNGVANKMMQGGMVFTISRYTDGKRKKAPDNLVIGYPVPIGQKAAGKIMGTLAVAGVYVDDDSVRNRRQIDSVNRISSKQIMDVAKEIRISGIKEITDSVISVFNEQGIKAAMGFVKRQPIVELAIPLKYVGLSIDNPMKFSYNIRVNGLPDNNMPPPPPPVMMGGGGAISAPMVVMGNGGAGNFVYAATDFWGEYVLVKGN
jgi:hypothetical protein